MKQQKPNKIIEEMGLVRVKDVKVKKNKVYKLKIPKDFDTQHDFIVCPRCKKKTMMHIANVFCYDSRKVYNKKGDVAVWYCTNPKCELKLW